MSACSKQLVKQFLMEAHQRLELLGFAKTKSAGIFLLPMTQEIVGWLGLNTAIYADGFSVNPIVGVQHQTIERMLAEIMEEKFQPVISTVGTPIGYLMPQNRYMTWSFKHSREVREVVDMVSSIQEYGIPFMEKNAKLESLLDTMIHSRFGHPHQLVFTVPIAYLLLGEKSEAEKFIQKELGLIGERQDPAAKRYRRFAASFLQRARNDRLGGISNN